MDDILLNDNMDTVKDYHLRIDRVLDYIDKNLGSELSLEELSEVAGFSNYHFHIFFHSLVGCSVLDYVKKRRLIAAANALISNPAVKIANAPKIFGFKQETDFSKSFRCFFGVSPYQYVKYTRTLISTQTKQSLINRKSNPFFERGISLVDLEDYTVAYIRNIGLLPNHRSKKIEASFIRLYSWANSKSLINDNTKIIGIALDNPISLPLDKCRYDACISVPENTQPEKEIRCKFCPGGSYVTYKFDTWNINFCQILFRVISYIYGFWLPRRGLLPGDSPCIKIFEKNNSHFDLYIPVKPH